MKRSWSIAAFSCLLLLPTCFGLQAHSVASPGPKKAPIILWLPPLPIGAGDALGPNQLNATANVPGTFTYNPPSGTVLPVGSNQILSADFTPTDKMKYLPVNNITVLITVLPKLDPQVTWENPADITYGTALGPDQLNAKAAVPGTFSYSPPAATFLQAGAGQVLTTTFTPSSTLYEATTKSVNLNVRQAILSCSIGPVSRGYGSPNPAFPIIYSGFVNGEDAASIDSSPIVTCAATATSPAGSTLPIIPSQGVDTNYAFDYQNGLLTITKGMLTAKADDKTRKYGLPNPTFSIVYTGFANDETSAAIDVLPVATTTAIATSPAGNYPITVSSGQDNNYNFTYLPGTLSVSGETISTITLSDFQIVTSEDSKLTFDLKSFQQNFSSYPGDSITSIKIVKQTSKGTLLWKTTKISSGDIITVVNGSLGDFSYAASPNANGTDTIVWNASDGTMSGIKNALLTIYVIPVNDPPAISGIDSAPVSYASGDPAVAIAQKLVITDVDDIYMTSAVVTVTDNHSSGDVLSVDGPISTNLTTSFDAATGILKLSGMDSKANYENALQHIGFSCPATAKSYAVDKTISITINDNLTSSAPVFKTIRITNFPEVNIVNAFTPNHDGVNDYWDFLNLEYYPEVKVVVYDQNGTQVFNCTGPGCKWDGKINGTELPAGSYFYSIALDGRLKKYNGMVTILK